MADDETPDRPTFAGLVKGVKPLAGRDRDRNPPRAGARPKAPAARGEALPSDAFVRPEPDEPLLGFAPGFHRRQLRRLRQGQWRPERRLDLHGLARDAARAAVRAAIAEATEADERCLLVIHGRGRGSPGEPVLRSALPGWLAEPPLDARVLAFCPAAPDDGGAGATYVLLRRT